MRNGLVDRIVTRHAADELTWVLVGGCEVVVDGVRHTVDTRTALVIPAGVEHEVVPRPDSVVFPLMFPDGLVDPAPGAPVTPVVRTPALEAAARVLLQPGLTTEDGVRAAGDVVRAHVHGGGHVALPPLPTDPRARVVAEATLRTPAADTTLDEWARRVHVSTKTLQRAFRATGHSFPRWRSAVRLERGRERLRDGVPIAVAARQVGYTSVSAFTTAFRERYGVTPGAYVAGSEPADRVGAVPSWRRDPRAVRRSPSPRPASGGSHASAQPSAARR